MGYTCDTALQATRPTHATGDTALQATRPTHAARVMQAAWGGPGGNWASGAGAGSKTHAGERGISNEL